MSDLSGSRRRHEVSDRFKGLSSLLIVWVMTGTIDDHQVGVGDVCGKLLLVFWWIYKVLAA